MAGSREGAVPCTIIILGGNLTEGEWILSCSILLYNLKKQSELHYITEIHNHEPLGLRKRAVKPSVIAAIICVRYAMLPLFGIAVVKAAEHQGFLPQSPLYQYVLLIQFTLPPAMSIGKDT